MNTWMISILNFKLAKPFKHDTEALRVFLFVTEHYHIIQIDDAVGQVQLSQGVLHEVLKSQWSIAEPKEHMSKLVKPPISHCEGGILLGLGCHLYLPKSALKVHC